jgi:hypothetical protein
VGQFGDEVSQVFASGGAFADQLGNCSGAGIEDHALVMIAHQAPNNIAAHPAQANHSKLHRVPHYCELIVSKF